MRCEACGHLNPPENRFCAQCGAKLGVDEDTTMMFAVPDVSGQPEHLTADDLAADQALLIVTRGPNAGTRYVISSDVLVIGRHPGCEFFLDDVTVSRRHAEIRRSGESFTLHDIGSLNGTYLNGERVETAALRSGDELRIGKYVIDFLRP